MPANQTKSLFLSKTIWAALVGVIALLIDIPDQEALVENVLKIVEGGAFIFALYGRLVADKKLT